MSFNNTSTNLLESSDDWTLIIQDDYSVTVATLTFKLCIVYVVCYSWPCYKLYKPSCTNTTRSHFFVCTVINVWNSLPKTMDFNTINAFR